MCSSDLTPRLVAARGTRPVEAWERSPVYLTHECHHAITKALHIAGMGRCPLRFVPIDAAFRMDPAALEQLVKEDRKQGLKPWILVASAGTVNSGAVDPLAALAEVAHREDLWLHVDGAFGLFAAASPRFRQLTAGIERADSVTMLAGPC